VVSDVKKLHRGSAFSVGDAFVGDWVGATVAVCEGVAGAGVVLALGLGGGAGEDPGSAAGSPPQAARSSSTGSHLRMTRRYADSGPADR